MFDKDFKEFLELLNSEGVEYLVVGGYAVAVHGYPRYTGDLDAWIAVSEDNALKVSNVMKKFGFGALGLDQATFLKKDQIVQLGYPPCRIDILTHIDGVSFGDCFKRKKLVDVEGLEIPFICLEDLKANKKASARSQDLADLEHLGGE